MWLLIVIALFAAVTASPSYVIRTGYSSDDSRSISQSLDLRIRLLCLQQGNPSAYLRFVDAKESCINILTGRFTQELGKAISKRESATAAQISCRIKPEIQECVSNITTALDPCMQQNQRLRFIVISNGTDALLDYMCSNNEERLNSFYAGGAQECLDSKTYEIKQCLRSAVSDNRDDVSNNDNRESALVESSDQDTEAQCQDLFKLQKCVVNSLVSCNNRNSSANFIDGMFSSVIKVTPCQKYKESEQLDN